MPYMKVQEDGKTAVYKKGKDGKPTGKRRGLHDTEGKADHQIAAIEANEKAMGENALEGLEVGGKMMGDLMQDDARVQYASLGGLSGGQACANCHFFRPWSAMCDLVCGDIVATGKCNLWLEKKLYAQPPIPVTIVDSMEAKSEPVAAQVETKDNGGILGWLKQTFGKKQDEDLSGSGFKELPGNKWVAYYTNNFEDRAGQIFSQTSHDQYIQWLDKGQIPMPELWYWHIPGTKHGQAEWIDRVDHVMVAVGSFDDTPMAQKFREAYRKETLTTSHTYLFPKSALQDGVYHAYFTIEISPLPAGKEANPYTTFSEVKEMPITDEKKAKLVAILGKETADQVLGNGVKISAGLEAVGIRFKEAEGLPAVDKDVREVLQAVVTANNAEMTDLKKQLGDLATAVKSLVDGEQQRTRDVTEVVAFIKEQFALAPRATHSPATLVSETNPYMAFLKENQNPGQGADAQPSALGAILAIAKQQAGAPAAPAAPGQ